MFSPIPRRQLQWPLLLLLAAVLHLPMLMASTSRGLALTGDTPWVVLGEANGVRVNGDSAEGAAYDLALRDLSADWYKVLGYTPIISAHNASSAAGRLPMPALYLGTMSSPWLTQLFDLTPCALGAGAEAHCVLEQRGSLVATGNTTRGAIFALYTVARPVTTPFRVSRCDRS